MLKIKQNKFKSRLNSGENLFGIWNGLVDSYAAEISAGAGFDWVMIDGEHAPFDLRSIIHSLQAVNQYEDTTAIVRVRSHDTEEIKVLLDAGVQNILVPMIESAEVAEKLAKSMRYPTAGTRGVGTALARAAQWNRVNNYFAEADEQMCLLLQVESIKGVQVLDDILKVEGVDVVFLGPADLAATMGHLGNAGHPAVVEIVVECIQKIKAAGKIAGFLTTSKELIEKYKNAGAQMIGVGLDTILLAKATQALAAEYKDLTNQASNTKY